ncbi:MAG: hypothetical protein ABIJ37_03070 [Pseudomonadota bacterium]
MPVTLDPTLASAQDSQSRKPLCRVYSCENEESIPFAGEYITTSTANEEHPEERIHSTGRLFVAYIFGRYLKYGYTDAERTFFTWVTFDLGQYTLGDHVSVCELADTYIGIVWSETSGGTRYIKYRKITVTGVDTDPATTGTIFSVSSSLTFSGPTAIKLTDDTYIMAYALFDGATDYHIYKRTSADFESWSAAGEIDLSTLDDTHRKSNPALMEISAGVIWLAFDYVDSIGPSGEELTNVYYVTSADKLITPSAPTALTSYSEYTEKAEHPAITKVSATDVYLAFDKIMASLHMDQDTDDWRGSTSYIASMHIDIATQKLYLVSTGGSGQLVNVTKIDLASWTIDKTWDTGTTPAFPAYFSSHTAKTYHGDGIYVPVYDGNFISVLNTQTDTIKNYAFFDMGAYGISKNVNWTTISGETIYFVWIDADNDLLYVALGGVFGHVIHIGTIDLTAAGPEYTFTSIVKDTDNDWNRIQGFGQGFMQVVPSADIIICGMDCTGTYDERGGLKVYSLTTGGIWKDYDVNSNPSFPYKGLKRGVYNDGKIAGDFVYQANYGQADYRGLCIIDLTTDVITYVRPSWASVNDYCLKNITLTDAGEYLINAADSVNYGITLYDGTWTLYNNDAIPGLTPSGEDRFIGPIVYNPVTEMIIVGHGNQNASWAGVIMFSRNGYLRQSNYREGEYDGSWSWTDIAPLVIGYTDYEASLCVDPDDDSPYAFWTNMIAEELSIKWDKATPSFDLTPYLLKGEVIERYSTIDPHSGKWDAGLEFSVSHGHLFDTSNSVSLLKQYLAKGRKLQQQFGETVSGADYWEPARIFTISDDGEITYNRGDYPVMKVTAETPRRRWEQIHIVASEYYTATPESIIADILEDYAAIPSESISLGTWDNTVEIEYQFVDLMLSDAIDQIAIHFGYSIRDGVNGIIEAVKISDAKDIDQTYTSNGRVFNVSPKNKESNFINRWTVECEEKSFVELIMAEELAAEWHGTHSWNTGSKDYRIDYTQGSKIFRNPRLEVVQSVKSIGFQLAGSTSEELVDNSHDEADQILWDTYCTISVSSPDLTPQFIAALGGLVGSYYIPDGVAGSWTTRIGSFVTALMIFMCLNILGATVNFQYQIYGQPVVKARRKLSATVDDLISQVKMGQIIADSPFQDPLCYSPADCLTIAEFRKMVDMGERARWTAEMVADLHNEEGDTISVIHPISGDTVIAFLTDLKTTFIMPKSDESDGTFEQTIEGWRR